MLVNTYLYKNLISVLLLILVMILNTISLKAQTFSLEQCIDTALQHNRNIKISQQDIYIADDKHKEIKSNLLPKLNGIIDYRYYTNLPYQLLPASVFGGPAGTYKEGQFGTPQNLSANLQLNIPVYNPTTFSNIQTSRLSIELTEIQKTKTEEDVVLEVSNAYYNAQILINQLAFLDSNIINAAMLVQTSTLMFQQQVLKGTDVDRLQLQLDQLNTQRATVLSQYRQVLNAVKFLIGKPLTDSLDILFDDRTIDINNLNKKVTTDIKLINKKLQLNNAELSGLWYTHLPSLSIYGMYGTTGYGNTGSNSFFNFYPIGYIGVQLTIPIFNGMITKHKIEQKINEIKKTNIQKELVTEKNNLEITNTRLQYQASASNVNIIAGQIELARKIYRNTVLQNKQGVASITELIMSDNSLREAQQNYIVALVNLRKSELEYKRVTGNLLNK